MHQMLSHHRCGSINFHSDPGLSLSEKTWQTLFPRLCLFKLPLTRAAQLRLLFCLHLSVLSPYIKQFQISNFSDFLLQRTWGERKSTREELESNLGPLASKSSMLDLFWNLYDYSRISLSVQSTLFDIFLTLASPTIRSGVGVNFRYEV